MVATQQPSKEPNQWNMGDLTPNEYTAVSSWGAIKFWGIEIKRQTMAPILAKDVKTPAIWMRCLEAIECWWYKSGLIRSTKPQGLLGSCFKMLLQNSWTPLERSNGYKYHLSGMASLAVDALRMSEMNASWQQYWHRLLDLKAKVQRQFQNIARLSLVILVKKWT